MSAQLYEGPVTFMDGWHWTVVPDEAGHDAPGEKLFSLGDGTYRLASDGDASHQDRYHERFVDVEMEDGKPALRLTPEELVDVKEFLKGKREGGEG